MTMRFPGRCEKCVFFESFGDDPAVDKDGMCVRYPPVPVVEITYNDPGEVQSTRPSFYWPEVDRDHGCGEFKEFQEFETL